MSFELNRKVALDICTNQVESIIKRPVFRNKIWTTKELHEHLTSLGLDYTLDEVSILNDELHKRGIVQDVAEVVPEEDVVDDAL